MGRGTFTFTFYIKGIEAIYSKQKAKIIINGNLSQECEISKGVKLGCPLSPLIFILTLEVLCKQIREEKEIKGIVLGNRSYKMRAFSDNLIITTEQPKQSLTKALEIIYGYGKVAGFKLNLNKTKLLVKNLSPDEKAELEKIIQIKIYRKSGKFWRKP